MYRQSTFPTTDWVWYLPLVRFRWYHLLTLTIWHIPTQLTFIPIPKTWVNHMIVILRCGQASSCWSGHVCHNYVAIQETRTAVQWWCICASRSLFHPKSLASPRHFTYTDVIPTIALTFTKSLYVSTDLCQLTACHDFDLMCKTCSSHLHLGANKHGHNSKLYSELVNDVAARSMLARSREVSFDYHRTCFWTCDACWWWARSS